MNLLEKRRKSWLSRRARIVLIGAMALIIAVSIAGAVGFYHCLLLRAQWERAVTLGSVLSAPVRGRTDERIKKITPLPPRLDDLMKDVDNVTPR